jgi:TPP-dependent indolepyruvate ferredoxin oxidoreductase alpha subunit
MLTGHQRILIRNHLPEVQEVLVIERLDPIVIRTIRLKMTDGSEIAIYGTDLEKASRSRLRPDYSDRVDEVPIPGEMRGRLELVFGKLRYRGDDA